MGGMFGAFGTVLALKQRERTGKGGLVESALFESVVFLMGQHLAITAMNGAPPPPMPERVSSWAIYEIFNTADGLQIFIGITSDGQWKRFCEFFKQHELAADPKLATNNLRIEARPWLVPKVAEIFKGYDQGRARADVPRRRHLLRAGRAAAGPVRPSAPAGQRLAGADHPAGRREDPPAAAAVPDAGLAAAAASAIRRRSASTMTRCWPGSATMPPRHRGAQGGGHAGTEVAAMHGRTIALAVAAVGWLVAGLIVFVLVASVGFAAIGVIGLLLWFISVRIDLEKDAAVGSGWTPHLIVSQHEARERMSDDERASWRHEQSLALESVRFFKHLGMALTLIGAAGLLWFQLL